MTMRSVFGGFEELLRIQLAGDEDESSSFLPDEIHEHLGPLLPQGPQVRINQQEGVVVAQLVHVVRQPEDGTVARLSIARIGMLNPGRELDALVAHQGVAQELHLRRGGAGDQQDADLLTHDFDRGRRDIVFQRQLRTGVLDRARNSYWPTTLGVIRNVVRLRIPSSPKTTR